MAGGTTLVVALGVIFWHVRQIAAMKYRAQTGDGALESRLASLESEVEALKEVVHTQAIELDSYRSLAAPTTLGTRD